MFEDIYRTNNILSKPRVGLNKNRPLILPALMFVSSSFVTIVIIIIVVASSSSSTSFRLAANCDSLTFSLSHLSASLYCLSEMTFNIGGGEPRRCSGNSLTPYFQVPEGLFTEIGQKLNYPYTTRYTLTPMLHNKNSA